MTRETPSRPADGPKVSTTIATPSHATTTITDAGGSTRRVDDRDRSWSPNQRGPRAFVRIIPDMKFPLLFHAPTNVPRYERDINPSVWLEDYLLACHAGGATDDLFIIKNQSLYLDDSAQTWREHLPCDKIND
jgi:hypothetical protein